MVKLILVLNTTLQTLLTYTMRRQQALGGKDDGYLKARFVEKNSIFY